MKGCARSCVLWLLGWAGASVACYFYLLRFGIVEPVIYWAAAGAGLCAAIVVSFLIAIRIAAVERSTLLESVVGTPPRDGKWVAVSGHIHAGHPVRAPLTGVPSVAFEYKIYRVERMGKSTSEVVYYQGTALVPSTITTRQGSVRLLAVPTLDVPGEELDLLQAAGHARTYIANTRFEATVSAQGVKTMVEHEATDDDGNYRVDRRPTTRAVDLNDCRYEQKSIRQDEMVCAFGLYSQQRGGLIPHPNWSKKARLMRGDATTVAGQLRNRILRYILGILIAAGVAYGIVRLYETYAPGTTLSEGAATHTRSSRTC